MVFKKFYDKKARFTNAFSMLSKSKCLFMLNSCYDSRRTTMLSFKYPYSFTFSRSFNPFLSLFIYKLQNLKQPNYILDSKYKINKQKPLMSYY